MNIVSRDLAIIALGLGPIVTGIVGRSSPSVSFIVMEITVLLFFLVDGYFRWKEGEKVSQVCRASALGLAVGLPLMAISLLLGGWAFGYLDKIVTNFTAG